MRTLQINRTSDIEAIAALLPTGWTNVAKRFSGRIVSGDPTTEVTYAALGIGFWNNLARRYGKTVNLDDGAQRDGYRDQIH